MTLVSLLAVNSLQAFTNNNFQIPVKHVIELGEYKSQNGLNLYSNRIGTELNLQGYTVPYSGRIDKEIIFNLKLKF